MQIKTNVRAGAGNQKRGSSADSTSVSTPDYVAPPPPPVVYTRCVGI
jgi:hypothetical protein